MIKLLSANQLADISQSHDNYRNTSQWLSKALFTWEIYLDVYEFIVITIFQDDLGKKIQNPSTLYALAERFLVFDKNLHCLLPANYWTTVN